MRVIATVLAVLLLMSVPASGQSGLASWYRMGQRTASGERYNPNGLTAAHRTLPFGSKVKVTDLRTGKHVTVRITDRGPFAKNRIIDLSLGAARVLGIVKRGVARVVIKEVP